MYKRPPIRVEKPVSLAVDLDQVREVCKVGSDVSDQRLTDLVETATAEFDGYSGTLGRALINQVWRQDFAFGCVVARLPFPDVSEATAVWRRSDGSETAIASLVLDEDVLGPFVRFVGAGWTTGTVLRVAFTAGFGDEPADVPAPIREAIIKRVGQRILESSEDGQVRSFSVDGAFTEAYNSPEQRAAEVERSVQALVKPYRRRNLL